MAAASAYANSKSDVSERQALWFVAPLAAMVYPLPLMAFHACVTATIQHGFIAWLGAGISLLLAFLAPGVALYFAVRLSAIEAPTIAELRARRVAFLAVAAPPIFTLTGVYFLPLGTANLDALVLAAFWAALAISIALSDKRTAAPALKPAPLGARVAHGVAAAAILLVFLGGHLINHLFGLAGGEAHLAVMKVLRHVYRARLVEPVLLLGFLFQIVTGCFMAWKLTTKPADRFRALQIASGVYLSFFLISHINAVLIVARFYLHIDPDWNFATGAPVGMIHDAWSIRLVPYYWLGVFFVLLHLASGARTVVLEHASETKWADRIVSWGAAASVIVSTLLLLGMYGLRLHS